MFGGSAKASPDLATPDATPKAVAHGPRTAPSLLPALKTRAGPFGNTIGGRFAAPRSKLASFLKPGAGAAVEVDAEPDPSTLAPGSHGATFSAHGFSIAHDGDGWTSTQPPEPIRNFIASGAGAKGLAYAGAYRAMVEHGEMKGVDNVIASSAGAQVGVLMASGVEPDVLDKMMDSLDFTRLLDQGDTPRSSRKNGSTGKLRHLALSLVRNHGTRAPQLEAVLAEGARHAVLDVMNKHGVRDTALHERLSRPPGSTIDGSIDPGVTFCDLRTLHRLYPDQIKEFTCTATATIDGRTQLAAYNADTAPTMSVAAAAMISALLPPVFSKAEFGMDGFMRESSAEGGKPETGRAMDGGALLNYPVPELLNSNIDNHGPAQNVVLMAASPQIESALKGRMATASNFADRTGDKVLKMNYSSNDKFLHRQTAQFHKDQLVIAPMKVNGHGYDGNAGLLRFDMPTADRKSLRDEAEAEMLGHLGSRQPKVARFDTLHEALLNLDDTQFAAAEASIGSNPDPAFGKSMQAARTVRGTTDVAMNDLLQRADRWSGGLAGEASASADDVAHGLREWAGALPPAIGADPAALRLMQGRLLRSRLVDSREVKTDDGASMTIPAHGMLDRAAEAIRSDPTLAARSPLLKAWSQAMKAKDVERAGKTITRDLIYPANARSSQSSANLELLAKAEDRLQGARTRDEVNAVLDTLSDGYALRGTGMLRAINGGVTSAQVRQTAAFLATTLGQPLPPGHGNAKRFHGAVSTLSSASTSAELKRALDSVCDILRLDVAPSPRQTALVARLDAYGKRLDAVASSTFLKDVQTYRLTASDS